MHFRARDGIVLTLGSSLAKSKEDSPGRTTSSSESLLSLFMVGVAELSIGVWIGGG